MKHILFILILFYVTGCTKVNNVTNIEFYDANNAVYNIDSAQLKLKSEFNLEALPSIVLVVTKSTNNEKYNSQMQSLATLDPEIHQYIYIISSIDREISPGYHTSQKTASELLGNDEFRIIIFDKEKRIVVDNNTYLNKTQLQKYLAKH